MTSINSLHSQLLDLPPSCIAFNPTFPAYFVVGTYYLHKDETTANGAQKRTGSLVLMKMLDLEAGGGGSDIETVQTLATDYAVLDIAWRPSPGPSSPEDERNALSPNDDPGDEQTRVEKDRPREILAVASSTGVIEFFHLQTDFPTTQGSTASSPSLHSLAQAKLGSALILSLSWPPGDAKMLSFTNSSGQVGLVADLTSDTDHQTQPLVATRGAYANSVAPHELEAWTAVFAEAPGEGAAKVELLSGGDDCRLACTCFRNEDSGDDDGDDGLGDCESDDGDAAVWFDRKIHQAGVTAIVPLNARLVVTGSYDESIRLIRLPPGGVGRREVLAELGLGGGVWRLKVIASDTEATSYTFLASCMHAGARVVRLQLRPSPSEAGPEAWEFAVLARFEEHQSMNYGCDVQPIPLAGDLRDRRRTIVSTSFYDKLLCSWHFGPEV